MKLKLNNVRLSFADLFEAVQFDGKGDFYFGCQLLVPEGDPQRATVDQAIEATAKEKWAAKAGAILGACEGNPQKTCWIDGKKREYEGYTGNWALSCKRPQAKGRPLVLDQAKNPVVAADGKVYSGCYVNASVELWCQDNSFGKGVRCTLLGVQFFRDGDAFSAGAAASPDDFEALAEGASADDLA